MGFNKWGNMPGAMLGTVGTRIRNRKNGHVVSSAIKDSKCSDSEV